MPCHAMFYAACCHDIFALIADVAIVDAVAMLMLRVGS